MPFVIVKHAILYKNVQEVYACEAYGGYSTKECGLPSHHVYDTREEAERDRQILEEFNPAVDWGVFEVTESLPPSEEMEDHADSIL